eukprot:8253732-Alexandrium_andersonii.AAC.1
MAWPFRGILWPGRFVEFYGRVRLMEFRGRVRGIPWQCLFSGSPCSFDGLPNPSGLSVRPNHLAASEPADNRYRARRALEGLYDCPRAQDVLTSAGRVAVLELAQAGRATPHDPAPHGRG